MCYSGDKVKYGLLQISSSSNTEENRPIWPEFEIIQYFICNLLIGNSDEDLIKQMRYPGDKVK